MKKYIILLTCALMSVSCISTTYGTDRYHRHNDHYIDSSAFWIGRAPVSRNNECGYYKTICQREWVPGHWKRVRQYQCDHYIRVWCAGYWRKVTRRVWVRH